MDDNEIFVYDEEDYHIVSTLAWLHEPEEAADIGELAEMYPKCIYFYAKLEVEEQIDYKALLLKYMDHVGVEEGTTFLSNYDRESRDDSVKFTDEEWAELQRLDGEE